MRKKLEKYGFEILTDADENNGVSDFDIKNLMDEFEYLNNEERVELCEVLQSQGDYNSVVYKVVKSSDGSGAYTIAYPSFSTVYHFDAESSQMALKRISEIYCGGEDPVLFYDWLITLGKEE